MGAPRDADIKQKDTDPIRVEQTGEHDAVCEHEDGSEFEFTFPGKFPSEIKNSKGNPGKSKLFSGIGEGDLGGFAGKKTFVLRGGELVEA